MHTTQNLPSSHLETYVIRCTHHLQPFVDDPMFMVIFFNKTCPPLLSTASNRKRNSLFLINRKQSRGQRVQENGFFKASVMRKAR